MSIAGLPAGTSLGGIWARSRDEAYVLGWRDPQPGAGRETFLFRYDGGGGGRWSMVHYRTNESPGYIFGVGASELYFSTWDSATNRSRMFRSTNATSDGLTFDEQALPSLVSQSQRGLGNIAGTPNNIHALVEGGYIIRFDGTTWLPVFTNTVELIYTHTLIGPDDGLYVTCWGWGSWDGTQWRFNGRDFDFCDIYGTWAIREAGQLHWYAVGNNNFGNGVRVWKFDEPTQSFVGKQNFVFSDGNAFNIGGANGIWGSAADDIYVIGALAAASGGTRTGRVYHYDGANWARETNFVVEIAQPRGISGTARDDVWISLEDGRVLRFTTGGSDRPPSITAEPADVSVFAGEVTSLEVTAQGSPPLQFQWYFNSNLVAGATSPLFLLSTNVQVTDAGFYQAIVTNAFGSVTSRVARLTVFGAPTIVAQPQGTNAPLGGTVTLSVTASGEGLQFQWYIGSSGDTGNPVPGGTGADFTTPAVTATTTYWVRVSNGAGSVDSQSATVTAQSGGPVDYVYWSAGDGRIKRARKDGSAVETILSGAEPTGIGAPGRFGGIAIDPQNGYLYTGDSRHLIRTKPNGSERTNLIAITPWPGSQLGILDVELDLLHGKVYWVDLASTPYAAIWRADLDGSNRELVVDHRYQPPWYVCGIALNPGTGKLFYAERVRGQIWVSNLDGTGETLLWQGAVDAADLENDAVSGQLYWNSPSGQAIHRARADGSGSIETVLTRGTLSDGFHLDVRGGAIYLTEGSGGLLRAKLDGTQVEPLLTDGSGNVWYLETATIAFQGAPFVVVQPQPRIVPVGGAATFTAVATGTEPLSYQWKRGDADLTDGGNISGARTPALTISNAQFGDEAQYSVVVSNLLDHVMSDAARLTVFGAPTIVVQPQGTNVPLGGTVTLNVTASGQGLQFQWYVGASGDTSNPVAGATGADFTTPALTATTTFWVRVSNAAGSADSQSATLTAQPVGSVDYVYWSARDGRIKRARTDGSAVETILSGAVPTGIGANGRFGGIAIDPQQGYLYTGDSRSLIRTRLNGSERTNLIPITPWAGSQLGILDVELDLVHGKVYWVDLASTVYSAIWRANLDGSNAKLVVDHRYEPPWYVCGIALDPGTGKLFYAERASGQIWVSNLDGTGETLLWQGADDAADLEIDAASGQLYWNSPSGQAIHRAKADGSGSIETVLTRGTLSDGFHLDVQGAAIYFTEGTGGLLRAKLDGTQVEPLLTDGSGNVWYLETATIAGVPVLVVQPQPRIVPVGGTATFTVAATGTEPLSYQWKKGDADLTDGGNISGARTPALTISNAHFGDEAEYSVTVSNLLGQATSDAVTLTVFGAPTLGAQPQGTNVPMGGTVTLSVTASGEGLQFQWRKNGANLESQTNSVLVLTNVQLSDGGSYTVVVANRAGGVTSDAAEVVVESPPAAWSLVSIPDLPAGTSLGGIWARSPDEAYVLGWRDPQPGAGRETFLFRYDGSGGGRWSPVQYGTNQSPGSIFGVGPSELFFSTWDSAANRSRIFRSTNGVTFDDQDLSSLGSLSQRPFGNIAGTTNNIHVLVDGGYIIRFNGTAWSPIFTNTVELIYTHTLVGPNDGLYVTCWGWGSWDGAQWRFNGRQFDFCDIYGTWAIRDANGLHWYAVGNNNFSNGVRIWRFDEATQSFVGKTNVVFGDPRLDDRNAYNIGGANGIWGSAADDIYVIGVLAAASGGTRTGRVYHYDGTDWTRVSLTSLGNIPQPRGITGTARDDVWISLEDGRVLRFTAGGSARPPKITAGPAGLSLFAGEAASLEVSAQGSPPLQFQWYFNSNLVAGATSNLFLLSTDVQVADAGFYHAVVKNSFGSVTSRVARVEVFGPPTIDAQPQGTNAPLGGTVTLSVAASGKGLQFQWRKNGGNFGSQANSVLYETQTNSVLVLTNVQYANGGSYTVVVANRAGVVTSEAADVRVGSPASPPAQDLFANRLRLVPTPRVQLTISGTNTGAMKEPGEPNHAGRKGGSSVWYTWRAPSKGRVELRIVNNTFDTLLAVYTGTNVSALAEEVSNDDDDDPTAQGGEPPFYTKTFESTVRFNAVEDTDYQIAVDGFGGATGYFILVLDFQESVQLFPRISEHPGSQIVSTNGEATFHVVAEGARYYEWYRNGRTNLLEANGDTLRLTNVGVVDVGTYSVVVAGPGFQKVYSRRAVLEISSDPTRGVPSLDKIEDDTGIAGRAGAAGPRGMDLTPMSEGDAPSFISVGAGINYQGISNEAATGTWKPGRTEQGIPLCSKSLYVDFRTENSGTFMLHAGGSEIDTVIELYSWTNWAHPLDWCTNRARSGRTNSVAIHAQAGDQFRARTAGIDPSQPLGHIRVNWVMGEPPGGTNPPSTFARTNRLGLGKTATLLAGDGSVTNNMLPMVYQWSHDGKTNNTAGPVLVLTNLTIEDSGLYSVVVRNDLGSITNLVAIVRVEVPLQLAGTKIGTNRAFIAFEVVIEGTPGDAFILQATTNLSEWVDLMRNTNLLSYRIVYSDTDAPSFPERFYRAVDGSASLAPSMDFGELSQAGLAEAGAPNRLLDPAVDSEGLGQAGFPDVGYAEAGPLHLSLASALREPPRLLQIRGGRGTRFILESTTDFITWEPVGQSLMTNSVEVFQVPPSSRDQRRYFRARIE